MPKIRQIKVIKKCLRCGEEKKIEDFYNSYSNLYISDGKQPICKSCILELYSELKTRFADDRKAIYLICQKTDTVFKSNYAKAAIEDTGGRFSSAIQSYFAKVNSAKALKDSMFENSDSEYEIAEVSEEDLIDLEYTISKDDIDKWGRGYTGDEYQRLNALYKDYCEEYGSDNLTTRKVYISLCKTEMARDKSLENGDTVAFEKLTTLISKLMADANLKPKELKGDSDKDDFSLGVWIDKWEQDAPLPEIQEEFKDVDRIEQYFKRIFVKPFRRTLGVDVDETE